MDLLIRVLIFIATGVIWIFITSYLKNKALKSKIEVVKDIAEDVVNEVENIAKKEGIKGDSKKQLAINMIMEVLKSMGLNIPRSLVSGIIESAVFWMNYNLANIKEEDDE